MDDSLMIIQASAPQITQQTVLALIIVAGLFVIGLLVLLGIFVFKAQEPLRYGNFFVVALGLLTALIGFLVAAPQLVSSEVFDNLTPTQVLTFLSALFGTIVGFGVTYLCVKASNDATVLLEHYPLVFSLLYGYVTVIGILYSYFLYRSFGINIFDYAVFGDFLLVAFGNPVALLAGGLLLGFIVLEYVVLSFPSLRTSFVLMILIVPSIILGAFAYFLVSASYDVIERTHSIKQGKQPTLEVRYRSSSGSADQVTEPGLELIGATQKVIFFYDKKDKHTLVIPQTEIVSIEVPD
jgi:hypothetical protein